MKHIFLILCIACLAACSHDPFTTDPIATTATVSNANITITWNFRGHIEHVDGSTELWSEERQQPYRKAAERWLKIIKQAGSLKQHTLTINVKVAKLEGGNGAASPDIETLLIDEKNVFPTEGYIVISNRLYSDQFRKELGNTAAKIEFDANIEHEIGHILGIGSLWNLDRLPSGAIVEQDAGAGSFRNWVQYDKNLKLLRYNQPNGIAAYNRFTNSALRFGPVSSGHLYSNDQNDPAGSKRFAPDGKSVASLDTELMAHRETVTPVLLGFLHDLGWVVTQAPK